MIFFIITSNKNNLFLTMDLIWKESNKHFDISLSVKDDTLYIDDITITKKRKGSFTKFLNYIMNELHKINHIIIVAVGTLEMHRLMEKMKYTKINEVNINLNNTDFMICDYIWTKSKTNINT